VSRAVSDRFPLRSFTSVLFLVLASVIIGVAAPSSSGLELLQLGLISASLLFALEHSGLRAHLRRLVLSVTVLAIVVAVVGALAGSDDVATLISSSMGVAIALAACILIFQGIRRTTITVDIQTVAAVLSIYLFIGVGFAAVYGVIDALSDTSIFASQSSADTSDRMYFAFITLATVGYGDLTPATRLMRAAAVGTAIIGQIYLVSIVAVVVSNLGRRSRMAPPEVDQGESSTP